MKAFQSHLLIAMPQLGDPLFDHSVILMVHHDQGGAMGLIVNKPMGLTIETFAKEQNLTFDPSFAKQKLYQGGPVELQRGWFIHTCADLVEKKELASQLFLSGTKESLAQIINKKQEVRMILGYAGWGAGQLEKEMIQGSWLTAPINKDHLFQISPDILWKITLSAMGINPVNLISTTGLQ